MIIPLITLFAAIAFSATSIAAATTLRTVHVSGYDGSVYSYTLSPADEGKCTFLLLHGFPSSSYDWRHTIQDLTGKGYGIVAPDLLGYGATDKPEKVEEYANEKISGHVAEILGQEGIEEVVGVGHDWGSGLLSAMWYWHPELFKSLAFLTTPYSPVGPNPIDLAAINKKTEAAFGYPIYGYWSFFNETDAASVIEAHHDSFTSILYPSNSSLWKTDVCPVGALKKHIEADKTDRAAWITEEEAATHSKILLGGGYTGPLNWYKAALSGLNRSPSLNTTRQVINKPVVFLSGGADAIGRPELAQQTADEGHKAGLLPKIKTVVVPNAGHWVQLEAPEAVAAALEDLGDYVDGEGEVFGQ